VWRKTERKYKMTSYNRKNEIKQAVMEQLEYVEKNLEAINRMLAIIGIEKYLNHCARLITIREIAKMQRWYYDNPCQASIEPHRERKAVTYTPRDPRRGVRSS